MKIKILPQNFTVCQVQNASDVDFSGDFLFFGKTDEELSLVCEGGSVPKNAIKREDGWKAMRIEGTLDFSLTGILSGISAVLAGAGIGIFAISTYNTDYILVKAENIDEAAKSLAAKGYEF